MSLAISCDQAIFTSIRTPVGEGYRIVAASRNLKPNEKQAITRNSPSHDSLCTGAHDSDDEKHLCGVSFFTLPTGRVCLAYSCPAGAEHTGRGGQRVYTHHLILHREDLSVCEYNPFVILRAMHIAGLTTPQVPPPQHLDAIELEITRDALHIGNDPVIDALSSSWRKHCLDELLAQHLLIINIEDCSAQLAEAMLLGIPGPLRGEITFSSGIRFSSGRSHNLTLIYDDQPKTKKRVAGTRHQYIDPHTDNAPPDTESSWLSFVDRHWSRGEFGKLASRTSKPFERTTRDDCERIGRMYNDFDTIPQKPIPAILELACRYFHHQEHNAESDIAAELVVFAQSSILQQLDTASWTQVEPHFPAVLSVWRGSVEGGLFAWPVIEKTLNLAVQAQPLHAGELVSSLVQNVPPHADRASLETVVAQLLGKIADWADRASGDDLQALPGFCARWRRLRPDCPVIDRMHRRCEAVAELAANG